MKHLLTILILTCATLHAQSVIIQGTGAGQVHTTGAGSVRGVVIWAGSNYSDGRFTVRDANTNVVIDNDSGLTWTRNANILGHTTNWYAGTNWAAGLDHAGYQEWRLPSITEFSRDAGTGSTNGLAYEAWTYPPLPSGHPFTGVQSYFYWSNTDGVDAEHAWDVHFEHGYISTNPKSQQYNVWPCRGP